jgi:DNA-binding winged helix-turn-helix (wHTH) protein/tetratricopeptide (TPR) repeat protein
MIVYRFGPFRLEKEPLLLRVGDAALPLGPKVVETLLALIEHPGQVLSKAELLSRVWPEGYVEEANLSQNIYVIRKTLRGYWDRSPIETVPRRGYRFTAPVVGDDLPATAPPLEHNRPRRRLLLAGGLAAALVLAVGVGMAHIATSRPSGTVAVLSPAGARLFAMGRYYWNQRTQSSVEKSMRYFEAVTRTDPHDARGYAGLASAAAIEGDYGYGSLPKRVWFDRTAMYAKHALELDPVSAPALSALGLAQDDEGHYGAGQADYRRAIAADPQYAPAHQWYGASLLRDGHRSQAYEELQKAANLDPESVAAVDWLAQAAYMARRYHDALSYARQALDLSPERYQVYDTIGMVYEALGDYRKAIDAYETLARSCASCRIQAAPLLAHAYAASHDNALALAQLHLARIGLAKQTIDPEDMVTALVAMGRRTEALRILHNPKDVPFPAVIAIDPRMDIVRGDRRFKPYIQSPG